MANDSAEVLSLLDQIVTRARKKAKIELDTLKDYFSLDVIDSEDTAYYFRKYKEQEFQIDENIVKQYFEYESVIE
jgi:Zn-dependent oligopeptidase